MAEAGPLPAPAPAPAPIAALNGIANPLLGVGSMPVAAPAGLQLAVIGGGVRLPVVEVAQAPVAEEQPIRRAASEVGDNAFLPSEAPTPVVPVYPRKQARH